MESAEAQDLWLDAPVPEGKTQPQARSNARAPAARVAASESSNVKPAVVPQAEALRINVYGMGYVGAVTSACFAETGHYVTGVDVSDDKVHLINQGRAPVVEPGLEDMLQRQIATGRIRATSDRAETLDGADVHLICVGTPSQKNGGLDLTYVEAVSEQIGRSLRSSRGYTTVVVRSTVLPGTTRRVIIPILEQASGKRAGVDFGVAMNPEFLRESTAIKDYYNPPMTIIGELDEKSGEVLTRLYAGLAAPLARRSLECAEMVKYACNAWHATKITFANEIGVFAKANEVDGRAIMDLVCLDHKLNISGYYMMPGFAFGGSCLPKDLRALTQRSAQLDLDLPMLGSVLRSNKSQIDKAVDLITSYGKKRIGLLGLSFKANTDDLRESPLVELAEILIGKGYELAIYDRNVEYARTNGANRDYINQHIPHVSSLLQSELHEVIGNSELLVIGNKDLSFKEVIENLPEDKVAVDLVGFMPSTSTEAAQGIAW